MTDRRFPPPWDFEEHNQNCYIVRDGNRQALAYVYFEAEAGRRIAAGLLTRDEARQDRGEHCQTTRAIAEGLRSAKA